MPNLLDLVRLLDTRTPKPAEPSLEPRRERRAKARDAVLASQPKRSRPVSNNLVKSN
jgi:hypothetical protein